MTSVHPVLRFLLADDNPSMPILMEKAIQMAKLPVRLEAVRDGEELVGRLRAAGNDKPHAVLMDLNMPRKDGREVLEEIGRDPSLSGVPFFVLSHSTAEKDVQDLLALGAKDYIRKPASFTEFKTLLESIAVRVERGD